MKPWGIASALLLTVTLILPACQTNPATGQSVFDLVSQKQAVQIGDQAAPKFLKQYGGPIPSSEIEQYVQALGQKLAAVSERPKLPWKFHAVDSKVINAFALPGGKIFITRGLLAKLTNEAQLAGVLGHEIGHINAKHITQQMSRQMGLSAGLQAIGLAAQTTNKQWINLLGAGAQIGSGLYMLSFSRAQETQADTLGVRYMTKLGYSPIAQVQVMQILKTASGGSGGIEMLQTHPLPQTRINDLEKLIKNKYPDYAQLGKYKFDPASYQQHVLAPLKTLPPAKDMPKSN